MNVNALEDSTSVLIELYRLQKSLRQKLKKLSTELTLEPQDEYSKLSSEELKEKLIQAEEKLIEKQNVISNEDEIIQMCLFGQEAFRALYVCEAGLDIGEHQNITLVHNKIATKMNELKDLNKQLLEKQDKAYELQQQLFDAKQRLQDIQLKNRDLYALLHHAEAASDKTNRQKKAERENSKTANLREALDDSLKELKLRREIFLGIIQASKIDWFADEQLRETVFSLSEPIALPSSSTDAHCNPN